MVDGWMTGESGGRKKGAGWRVAGCWGLSLAGTMFDSLCARLCIAPTGAGISTRCFWLKAAYAAWDPLDGTGKPQPAGKLAADLGVHGDWLCHA